MGKEEGGREGDVSEASEEIGLEFISVVLFYFLKQAPSTVVLVGSRGGGEGGNGIKKRYVQRIVD